METLQVIRSRQFSKLWIAQVLSLIAQNFLNFALIIRVFDLAQGTHFANVSVSLVVLAFGIPSVFFAAVAGVYVDHWDRRLVMVGANITRALLVLAYPLIEKQFILVLVLTFLVSTATQFFTPAEAATIPLVVKRKLLIAANSLFVLTFYVSFVVGYSLAAPVIKFAGSTSTYYITALLFATATLFSYRLPKHKVADAKKLPVRDVFRVTKHELDENRRTILRNRNLYFPILQLSLIQALIGIVLALAPALSLAVLKLPLEDASHFLIIPTGIGLVIGVALVAQLAKRASKQTIISAGFVVLGAALTALGLTGQLFRRHNGHLIVPYQEITLIVGGLMLILGLMNAIVSVSAQTILQESSPDAERGRIFGALNMMINLAATVPILFAGVLTDLLHSVTRVITAVGVLLLIFAIAQMVYLHRHTHVEARPQP
ncbi:MAG TPA: MFS transporter [Candidatus Nanoarchaeia archaeon]|nr:MFS transporter [Candidatus Nanoarchaeia archaeon]